MRAVDPQRGCSADVHDVTQLGGWHARAALSVCLGGLTFATGGTGRPPMMCVNSVNLIGFDSVGAPDGGSGWKRASAWGRNRCDKRYYYYYYYY